MLRLIACWAVAAGLNAQTQATKNDQDPARVARDPFMLARFLSSGATVNWETLREALGEKSGFVPPCASTSAESDRCSTELITVLDPDQFVLLIQGDESGPNDVYLRFLKGRRETNCLK